MLTHLRPALVLLVALTAITGLAYPLAVTGVSAALFPRQAEGSIVRGPDGRPIGSMLIGQTFASDRYFHGRPSATTGVDPGDATRTVAVPYNAANSGGSNLGPTNQALADRLKADVDTLRAENPSARVPVDLVTRSASGLDPHISPEAALIQVPRVANARGLPDERVRALVSQATEGRLLGLWGEPRVNVLALNMSLDSIAKP